MGQTLFAVILKRVAYEVATAGFLSHCLRCLLPYVPLDVAINKKICCVRREIKHFIPLQFHIDMAIEIARFHYNRH